MSPRKTIAFLIAVACVSQVGCCGCLCGPRAGAGCGMCDASCGVADPCCGCPTCGVADPCCGCPTCGVADGCCDCASCGVADPCCGCPTCGCPEPSCACDASCGVPCGCGTPVCGNNCGLGQCPILRRLKNLICGCNSCAGCGGCGCETYYGDWQCNPPCPCDPCDQCGNYTGAQYASPLARRSQLARRGANVADDIRFASRQGSGGYR